MSAREAAAESPWLIVHEARNARVRLFCFHYAGATASIFRTWPGGLPDWIEVVAVQLPGREYRRREPPAAQAGAGGRGRAGGRA
ncbi:thioesterase II family protein, partial [Burkholderia pseudomallei]|uniref:thioesterase II family protein n=1 Tax=Burkholderia pseudomallei TaxID=28450 RepID=UPI00211677ED